MDHRSRMRTSSFFRIQVPQQCRRLGAAFRVDINWYLFSRMVLTWFSLGVPYHSWRISHAKHHASTSHLTLDQAYVPRDRAYLNIPELDHTKEELLGGSVSEEVKKELVEALGDSPIGTFLGALKYLVSSQHPLRLNTNSSSQTIGWPAYLLFNSSGQARYPFGLTNRK